MRPIKGFDQVVGVNVLISPARGHRLYVPGPRFVQDDSAPVPSTQQLITYAINRGANRCDFVHHERAWDWADIPKLADRIREVAAGGVRVFVHTRDYLLLQHLSIPVEYRQTKVPHLFTNLYCHRPSGQYVVEQGPNLTHCTHLEVQDAYRKLYEYELRLAAQE